MFKNIREFYFIIFPLIFSLVWSPANVCMYGCLCVLFIIIIYEAQINKTLNDKLYMMSM